MDREWDNARACFRSAQFHDSSEEAGYDGDYALFDYLDGFLTSKLGGDGSSNWKAPRGCPNWPSRTPSPQMPMFSFFRDGKRAIQMQNGEFGQKLQFTPVDLRRTRR